MTFWSQAHGRFLAFLSALFVLEVALGIHGYSMPEWHRWIDGSPAPEVLLGSPKSIRSDDWNLDLPLMLAQREHSPQFPVINRNIGFGYNMLAPIQTPAAHW